MKARVIFALSALLALGGCALLPSEPPPESNAALRFDRGLAALEAGRYETAIEDLSWVYSRCAGREASVRALTVLASLEIDPRNPLARPHVGTELLGRVIQSAGTPEWVRPVAESAFLTALGLGARHPQTADTTRTDEGDGRGDPDEPADTTAADLAGTPTPPDPGAWPFEPLAGTLEQEPTPPVYGCGSTVVTAEWVAPPLPHLPGPSMADLLREAEARGAAMALRVDSLETQLRLTTEQLAATREELDRIRRTLKP